MNPIIPIVLGDDDEKDTNRTVIIADEEQLPVNRYEGDEDATTRMDERNHENESSLEQPHDNSSSSTNEKSDPKKDYCDEKTTKNDDGMDPSKTSSSSSSSLGLPAPPAHLSRQNMARALQPGAFGVTPTHIYPVQAARNNNRRNRVVRDYMDEDGDIESNGSEDGGNDAECIQEEVDCHISPGPIEAQLVPSPSVMWRAIPRAEVIDPVDPTVITKTLEEEDDEEEKRHQTCIHRILGRRAGVNLIILSICVFLFLGLLGYVLYRFFDKQPTLLTSSSEAANNCSQQQIDSACLDAQKQNNSTNVESQRLTSTEIEELLRSNYQCKPDRNSNIWCLGGGEKHGSENMEGDQSHTDNACPPPNMTWSAMCDAILEKLALLPMDSDYTKDAAQKIAIECDETDPWTICDVYDEVVDNHSRD